MPRPAREIPWLDQKDGTFYVNWYDREQARTKRESLRTSDPDAAKTKYISFLASGKAESAKPTGITAKQALDRYYFEHVRKNCADHVRQETAMLHLKEFFGDMPINAINARKAQTYAEARGKGLICGSSGRKGRIAAPATARRELNVLIAAMNFCAKWGYAEKAEINDLALPAVELAEGEEALWYTRDELAILMSEAEGDLRDFIVLAYYTGARRAAIERLTIPQVRLSERRIMLLTPGKRQTKKKMPIVPIFAEIEDTLRRMIGDRKDGTLFTPVRDMYRPFHNLCVRLGMPEKSNPHLLRHTRATHLLQSGASIFQVAKLLGDTIKTVERVYGHHSSDYLREVL